MSNLKPVFVKGIDSHIGFCKERKRGTLVFTFSGDWWIMLFGCLIPAMFSGYIIP
jgi:hypothetical protein